MINLDSITKENNKEHNDKWSFWSTISHINYWDQVNSWKNLWKFWNGPLCRNKSGPSPLLNVAVYWQSSDTRTCVKKLSQILANNTDNGGRGIGLRIYVKYCPKKWWKIKGGLGKPGISFSLNSVFLMSEICQIVLGLIGSLLDHFDSQET